MSTPEPRGQPRRPRPAAALPPSTPDTIERVAASMRRDGERWLESYTQRTATAIAARAHTARAALNGHAPLGGA